MPDLLDRAAELEQRQRDQALKAALNRPKAAEVNSGEPRYCCDCAEQIATQRLVMVPYAMRCTDCQTITEQREKQLYG